MCRIKMIVFPRYKIPRHYIFHHQRKNNLKEIRKHPRRDYLVETGRILRIGKYNLILDLF